MGRLARLSYPERIVGQNDERPSEWPSIESNPHKEVF